LPKLLLVNNYGPSSADRALILKHSLERAGASVEVASWAGASSSLFSRFDGVVLSGSHEMLSRERTRQKFASEAEAVVSSTVPFLGICFGHQLIGHAFGSRVLPLQSPVKGYVDVEVVSDDRLFSGLPGTITVLESHHEVVTSLPPGFVLLARSRTSDICAMRKEGSQIYGVQFHPERSSGKKPHGQSVLSNFVRSMV